MPKQRPAATVLPAPPHALGAGASDRKGPVATEAALARWHEHYPRILTEFGWREAADGDAARVLAREVAKASGLAAGGDTRQRAAAGTHASIAGRLRQSVVEDHAPTNATVLGCGPGLAAWNPTSDALRGTIVIAADGAASRCQELQLTPHIVVTDLDGEPESLQWAAERGAWMVVHGHADNVPAIRELVPHLGERIVATRQSLSPVPGTALAGGFTDGDRAVLLAEALGLNVQLVGFETKQAPSRYSHRTVPETKRRKLAWAERILGEVAARRRIAIANHATP